MSATVFATIAIKSDFYTHNIINLSDTEPLVTHMWANELFDPDRPDTYYEKVTE